MQPSNELSTTQQRPRYMLDEFYNIGRVTSPGRIIDEFHNIGRVTSPGRIYVEAETDVTPDELAWYGKFIEAIMTQALAEETIDYDII